MPDKLTPEKDHIYSLLSLNRRVKDSITRAFPDTCWMQAETSDVRTNAYSGHCYLEFIEKDPRTGQIVAKARGTIWASTYRLLQPYFEQETKQSFGPGIKVLVMVKVDFHELYGFNMTVVDIDPTYTLGDMVRRRMEIIHQLEKDGVFTLNKELVFPKLPRRIAVITSPTAAGYEDFMSQLTHNIAGFVFYTKLFPAVMQGEKTETSIIAALDNVYAVKDHFDVVVIIRGGGATSDLNCFDSYLLAANCAQFPLPVITGIGHERDDTVVDMVAHTRMKTPTAVAEFLIGKMDTAFVELNDFNERIHRHVSTYLFNEKNNLQLLSTRLPGIVMRQLENSRSDLQRVTSRLPLISQSVISRHKAKVDDLISHLKNGATNMVAENKRALELNEQFLKMVSPEYILKRGYSLTLYNGKIIKNSKELKKGDRITSRFTDGTINSIIE